MTDENRAELRRGLEMLIRSFLGGLAVKHGQRFQVGPTVGHVVRTGSYPPDAYEKLPPITTAQQLALSVLLGDEAVLPQALADYLLDQGHEYATAVAEKARAEERERCAKLVDDWIGRDVTNKSLRCRLLIEIDGREIPGFAPGGPDHVAPPTPS